LLKFIFAAVEDQSNRPLDDWGKIIGDTATATAILDRFLHHATVITIKGRSYRLAKKQKVLNKKK
jgi:DNA replication protein DnaC